MWMGLAQGRAEAISHGFSQLRGGEGLTWQALVVGLVLLVLVLIIARGFRAIRRSDEQSRPTGLFLQLAEALGLGWRERWLLWRIARQQHLPSAITLLLSRQTLLHQGEAYSQSVKPQRRERVLEKVSSIASVVFD